MADMRAKKMCVSHEKTHLPVLRAVLAYSLHAQHRGLLARAPKSFMFPVLVSLSLIPSTRRPDVNTYAELTQAGGRYTPGLSPVSDCEDEEEWSGLTDAKQ
ncbi:unnamed protein product [Boreogadus saida]